MTTFIQMKKKQKPLLILSNSQFNKKTYENPFYKKTFDKYVPIREQSTKLIIKIQTMLYKT